MRPSAISSTAPTVQAKGARHDTGWRTGKGSSPGSREIWTIGWANWCPSGLIPLLIPHARTAPTITVATATRN